MLVLWVIELNRECLRHTYIGKEHIVASGGSRILKLGEAGVGQTVQRVHHPGEGMGGCGGLSTLPLVGVRGASPGKILNYILKIMHFLKQNMPFYSLNVKKIEQ